MSLSVRLDKYLADLGIGTRSEVKVYIKKGRVKVNGEIIKASDFKVEAETSEVLFDNEKLSYENLVYYMLNKPAGVVSATIDNVSTTVIELLENEHHKDLFPVGRLDKDTEGLLILTNDGDLAHKLLSPKKHVAKVYLAKINGRVTEEDVRTFAAGIPLDEDFTTLPAELQVLESGETSIIKVTIYEGKFHQVKRMFEAVDKEVIYLKRLSMGSLILDESLESGDYRRLTEDELNNLKA